MNKHNLVSRDKLQHYKIYNRRHPQLAELEMLKIIMYDLGIVPIYQSIIGSIIPDILIKTKGKSKCNLYIQVDGEYHNCREQMQKDIRQDAYIHSKGHLVLRFTNNDVFNNKQYVIKQIESYLKMFPKIHPQRFHSPQSRERFIKNILGIKKEYQELLLK